MEQNKFHQILKRYRLGQTTAEEEKMIDAWYDAMGKQSKAMLSHEEEQELEKRYWLSIASHLKNPRDQRIKSIKPGRSNTTPLLWPAVGIAASVLFAIIAFVYITNSKSEDLAIVDEASWQGDQITNPENIARQFTLPDGSTVTLEPQSSIKLSQFNVSGREVHLEGEAFFDVTHNKQQPFIVHANEIITKVLGTSFSIKAYQRDKNVTVAVKTGKVSVYTNSKSETILTPNQQIIYDKDEDKISRRIVEAPKPILPEEEIRQMRFEEAPVKEIFKAIERIYGVDIVFDEALFSSCTLTTSVSDGGLYNRLNIITSAIGAEYKMDEDKIVITGRCE